MTRPLRGAVPHDPADDSDPAAPATGATLVGAMHRALAASVAVHGTTSPNPPVGAVVLDAAGVVAGVGATAPPGGPHAEVIALREAGPRARGGTVVVTLEPCAHTGRTPPCTEALAAAGVATVVFAVRDPHPTAGGGAAVLRAGGVAVREGVLADEVARGPLRAWLHAVRTGRPHVTWKLAATLDGRSAAADGTSRWITGADARAEVHALRAGVDAIVVGTGTVLADDPSLTARRSDGSLRERSPLRVVVGHRDVPSGFALDAPDVLHLRTRDPDAVLAALHDRGVVDVLLEGGPRLAGAFVAAHRVDRVLAYLAPALLGAGPAALDDAGVGTIADIARLQVDEVRRVGVDVLVDARPERTLNGGGPARAGSAGSRRAGDGREHAARGHAARGHAAERGGVGVHRHRRGDRRGRRRAPHRRGAGAHRARADGDVRRAARRLDRRERRVPHRGRIVDGMRSTALDRRAGARDAARARAWRRAAGTRSTWSGRARGGRLGGHIVQGHVDGVGDARSPRPRRRAGTSCASPARRWPGTWWRRARSPWTACR